jgi:NAD(P)-dependent dehydrogenase (short-subunit alcohol dehydrogenase family)
MPTNATFKPGTGALEVAQTFAAQAKGKTVLITGVSQDSLGDFIARALAHGGASTIIPTGRDPSRLKAVTETLSSRYPATRFRPLTLNLGSLKAVDKSAKELLSDDSIPQIDIYIACAGAHDFNLNRTLSPEGLEKHLVVNYLSHYLLMDRLLPKIRAAARANQPGETRIVTLTSDAHVCSPFRFSDYNFDLDGSTRPLPTDEKPDFRTMEGVIEYTDTEGYEHTAAYAQGKTACMLWAVQVNKVFASEGIRSFCVNPGIVYTQATNDLWQSFPAEQRQALNIQTGDQGASTVVLAALDPGLKPEADVVFAALQPAQGVPDWAVSPEKAAKLWELSSRLIETKVGA